MIYEIITLYLHLMKKATRAEYFHTFLEQCEKCATIVSQMGDWLNALKAAIEEELRIFNITDKSPLTEEALNIDRQRDGLLTAIDAAVLSYMKSSDGEKAAAAKALEVGLSAVRGKHDTQYITETGIIDKLLNFLIEEQAANVNKLMLMPLVQELKLVNDRMHEIIEGRVSERVEKPFGAYEEARALTDKAYRDFIKTVNSWAWIFNKKMATDYTDLLEFILWANANIAVYNSKVIKPGTKPGEGGEITDEEIAGDETVDGDNTNKPSEEEKPGNNEGNDNNTDNKPGDSENQTPGEDKPEGEKPSEGENNGSNNGGNNTGNENNGNQQEEDDPNMPPPGSGGSGFD